MRIDRTKQRLTEVAHEQVSQVVVVGNTAVDATAGNGHDTVFLRRCVGDSGRVYSVDVQTAALDATRKMLRLSFGEIPRNVVLEQRCHSGLADLMANTDSDGIHAAMFNLGYLPGGCRDVKTEAATTLSAVQQSAALLRVDGILSVMVYTGQEGGCSELSAIQSLVNATSNDPISRSSPRLDWRCFESDHAPDRAPKLFMARKR